MACGQEGTVDKLVDQLQPGESRRLGGDDKLWTTVERSADGKVVRLCGTGPMASRCSARSLGTRREPKDGQARCSRAGEGQGGTSDSGTGDRKAGLGDRAAQFGMMAPQFLAAEMKRGMNVRPQFFEKRTGGQYYDVTMPRLVQQVTRLADAMELVGRQLVEIKVEMQGRVESAERK